ncbi:hypothetical protein RB594_001956 [Gaeumannomyces avenae]
MNPHQKNKIDINPMRHDPRSPNPAANHDASLCSTTTQSLSPEEQRLFRLYGKLPSKSDHFAKHLKERKYFDSGDYALSKAGKADSVDAGSVGSQHPVPENIPHLSSPVSGSSGSSGLANGLIPHLHPPAGSSAGVAAAAAAGSPVKESSILHRETSADDAAEETDKAAAPAAPAEAEQAALQQPDGAAKAEAIPIRG